MAHLNHRGPEEKGPKTGRMLGLCSKTEEEKKAAAKYNLGKGLGQSKDGSCKKTNKSRNRSADFLK